MQAGDYGIKVANQFGVSLEDLQSVNGWADASKEFPGPGAVIIIPPAALRPHRTPPRPTVTKPSPTQAAKPARPSPIRAATVRRVRTRSSPGDIPLKLVEQYDVTLEALDAANANNPAYGRFIPGEKIIIPAKDDC